VPNKTECSSPWEQIYFEICGSQEGFVAEAYVATERIQPGRHGSGFRPHVKGTSARARFSQPVSNSRFLMPFPFHAPTKFSPVQVLLLFTLFYEHDLLDFMAVAWEGSWQVTPQVTLHLIQQ
jgi:hypothetical protein